MKLIIVALMAAAVLSFNFDFLEFKEKKTIRADEGEDMPFAKDVQALSDAFSHGDYSTMVTRGMSLFRDLKSTLLNQSECPYVKCVKERLCKAKKPAKAFVCALFHGETERAQKVLKCLHKALYHATLCKKKD